jgi:cell division initiation protein
MIDLTPLDVRNKRGDFKKLMRGYDPQEVDVFLELAAERLEALVRENLQLRERTQTLQNQVSAQTGREQAVQDALVTAQELRADIRAQSQREAEHVVKEAEAEARRLVAEAEAEVRAMIGEAEAEVRSRLRGIERQLDQAGDTIQELERRRMRFLKEYRGLLEREMDVVDVEEDRAPFEDRAIDLELGAGRGATARADANKRSAAALPEPTAPAAAATPPDAWGDDSASLEDGPRGSGAQDEASVADAHSSGLATREPREDPVADPPHPPVTDHARSPLGDDPQPSEAGRTHPPGAQAPEANAAATAEAAAASGAPSGDASTEDASAEASAPRGAAAPSVPSDIPVEVQPPPLRPSAPPPEVGDEPSSLELELMAGAESARVGDLAPGRFEGVPDLETVLAEAGIDEVTPPTREEISPPPATQAPTPSRREDPLILFDPDDKDRKR